MAKSPTRKKSKSKRPVDPAQLAEIEQGVKRAVEYIDNWKKRELEQLTLKTKGTPICIPISKTALVVGRYGIKKEGQNWVTVNSIDSSMHNFSRRATAIVYTLCDQKNQKRLARDILHYDTEVIKITEEIETYSYKKECAKRKRDYWRIDHFDILGSRAEFRLEEAMNQLEKSINLAKYFKIWE